jgi:hypothetical protein
MNQRTEILQGLLLQFVTDGIVLQHNTSRVLQFLHEVNDFPAICISSATENRIHIGAGQKLAQIAVTLRGFTYGSIADAEDLGRSIEQSIDAFARSAIVSEARVVAFRTDEGLFEPYGIADITAEITYEVGK